MSYNIQYANTELMNYRSKILKTFLKIYFYLDPSSLSFLKHEDIILRWKISCVIQTVSRKILRSWHNSILVSTQDSMWEKTTNKNSAECYVASVLPYHLKSSMKAWVTHVLAKSIRYFMSICLFHIFLYF